MRRVTLVTAGIILDFLIVLDFVIVLDFLIVLNLLSMFYNSLDIYEY